MFGTAGIVLSPCSFNAFLSLCFSKCDSYIFVFSIFRSSYPSLVGVPFLPSWSGIRLMLKTRALVRVAGFEDFVTNLSEASSFGILVQALTQGWWDIAHTSHIAGREMTLTPYDFHRLTGLKSYSPVVHLGDAFGGDLVVELLGCAHPNETIQNYLLTRDFTSHSQATPKDRARMAKAFLLRVVGATVLANANQTVPLRWLEVF